MKANSPNGSRIVGTKETIPGCALIRDDSFARAPDGTMTFDHAGETKLWWDDQFTVRRRGQTVFVDEDGAEWTGEQVILAEEEERADA